MPAACLCTEPSRPPCSGLSEATKRCRVGGSLGLGGRAGNERRAHGSNTSQEGRDASRKQWQCWKWWRLLGYWAHVACPPMVCVCADFPLLIMPSSEAHMHHLAQCPPSHTAAEVQSPPVRQLATQLQCGYAKGICAKGEIPQASHR